MTIQNALNNPNTPSEILELLGDIDPDAAPSPMVSLAYVEWGSLSSEELGVIKDYLRSQGIDPDAPSPPELLDLLFDYMYCGQWGDWRVIRQKVVKDWDVDPDTLDGMAATSEWDRRLEAAFHPNTRPQTLDALSWDDNWQLRWVVALNDNTPAETLRRLSEDAYEDVRNAAKNVLTQRVSMVVASSNHPMDPRILVDRDM